MSNFIKDVTGLTLVNKLFKNKMNPVGSKNSESEEQILDNQETVEQTETVSKTAVVIPIIFLAVWVISLILVSVGMAKVSRNLAKVSSGTFNMGTAASILNTIPGVNLILASLFTMRLSGEI